MSVSISNESALRPERPFVEENFKKDRKGFEVSLESVSESATTETKVPNDRQVLIGCRLDPMSPEKPSHSSLDYALIEVSRDFKLMPRDAQPCFPLLNPHGIAVRPRDGNVLTVTGSNGLLNGIMSGTPSFKTIPGSNKIQELWTVRLEGNLSSGDCGSWIIDAENGELFGHIVAGSPKSGVGYIIPAYVIIEDAKMTFGLDLELYQPTELKVATELDSIAKDGPSIGEAETHPAVDPKRSPKSQESDQERLSIVNDTSASVHQNDCNNSKVPNTKISTVDSGSRGFYMLYLECK
jgi:hypothetical protein